MHTRLDKGDNSSRRRVQPVHYKKMAGAARQTAQPTQQETLEYMASLARQLQEMAIEVGEQEVALYFQLAHREALRSSQAGERLNQAT